MSVPASPSTWLRMVSAATTFSSPSANLLVWPSGICVLLGWLTLGCHTQRQSTSILIKRINMSARWLTAEQATVELSVSRQTLYAYVSRGRIGVMAAPEEPRRSLYDAA